MNEAERDQIKGALLKCAEENENRPTFTGYVVVSSICRSAVERIEELEQEIAGLKASKSRWHDLQEDSTDLPPEGIELLVSVDGYTRTAMYSKETNSFTCQDGVIAWMYEPEFKR